MGNFNQAVPGIGGDATVPGGQRSGTIFPTVVRSLTGASGGTASGAYVSQEFSNPTARGVRFYVVASGAATGTATFKVQVIDPVTQTWGDLFGATTAALNGTGAASTGPLMLTVYPGLTGIADNITGANINQALGLRWRGVLTIALSTSTCSVGADYLL